MKILLWKLRLAFWLMVYGYGYSRWRAHKIVAFAFEDCWDLFREDGYTPRDAVIEDASNL